MFFWRKFDFEIFWSLKSNTLEKLCIYRSEFLDIKEIHAPKLKTLMFHEGLRQFFKHFEAKKMSNSNTRWNFWCPFSILLLWECILEFFYRQFWPRTSLEATLRLQPAANVKKKFLLKIFFTFEDVSDLKIWLDYCEDPARSSEQLTFCFPDQTVY